MGSAFQQDNDIRERSWHAEGIFWSRRAVSSFQMFFLGGWGMFFFLAGVGCGDVKDSSEALGLLQEAGLGGQRHEGRGQAS